MANLTAAGQSSPVVQVQGGDVFDISVSGTFVGTVVLERSKDGTTYFGVEQYTAPTQLTAVAGSSWAYRLRCSAFTSGTIVADIFA